MSQIFSSWRQIIITCIPLFKLKVSEITSWLVDSKMILPSIVTEIFEMISLFKFHITSEVIMSNAMLKRRSRLCEN